jgi:orotidine-5'-phosphate decarboxylase
MKEFCRFNFNKKTKRSDATFSHLTSVISHSKSTFDKDFDMKQPKDYIIFPLDVATADEAKRYVELLADSVGLFKVGLELFIRSGPGIVGFINSAGSARVFLDLKLHDIPATVSRAMNAIADLDVHFATVHCGEAPKMLAAAVAGSGGRVHILGVTVLTSVAAEDIEAAGYRAEFCSNMSALVLKRARMAAEAGCSGVVCSGLEAWEIKKQIGADFVAVTPGIRPAWAGGKNDDQQRVTTPAQAVINGSDYLVIGRPIRDAADPVDAAKRVADEIKLALMK